MTQASNQILEPADGIETFAQSAGSLPVRDDHHIASPPRPRLGQLRRIAPAIAIATQLLLVEEIPNYEIRPQVAISNRDVIFEPAGASEEDSAESSDVFVIPRVRPVLFAMKGALIQMVGSRRPFIVATPEDE